MTYLGNRGTYYIVSGSSTPNSVSGDAYGSFKLYYEYEPTNLRYKVNVECYLRRYPMTGGYLPDITGNIRPTVNGNNGTQVSYSKSGTAGSSLSNELISTQTFYVPINISDGTASVSFSGRFYGNLHGGYTSTRSCSYTWSLPTVPVSSAITNDTSSSSRKEFGTSVTFTITPPANSNFTHTLTYNVGGTDYTIASASSLTTITYTFSTSLINNFQIGNPSITVNCLSSNGTTSSTEVFLQVPDIDTYRPTINSIVLEDMLDNKPSALNGLWIKNKSILKGTITATPKTGASISSYLSSISGFSTTYNTNPFTTQALTIAGNRVVTCQVTDTRNLSKSATQNITVIDYDTPSISSAKVERCLQDGTLDESGSYGKVTVTYKVYELNDGNTDRNTVLLKVKKDSDTSQTITTTNYSGTVSQVFNFALTETSTSTFTFTLTDIFSSVIYNYTIGIAFKTVSKRAGGKGIAFGKVATQDGFDCNMEAIFRQDIYYKGLKLENNSIYSTQETIIGTWKDGRPVYRKIITFTTVAGGGQVDTINNLDEIVDLKGSYVGQGNKFPPQYYLNNDYNLRTYAYGIGIFYACSGYTDYSADIIIDYIKTV